MNFEDITKTIQTMLGVFGAFTIILAILTIIIFWLIIKSAVKAGVKEALKEVIIDVRLYDVAEGTVINWQNITPRQKYNMPPQQPQWTQGRREEINGELNNKGVPYR